MASLAEQISMRATQDPVEAPSLDPMPLTAESVLRSAKQAQIANEDPWEVAQMAVKTAADPQKMLSILNNIASDFDEHAPQAAISARMATARMINFLASKAPKASVYAPGMPEIMPSKTELNRFERYMRAVKDPTSVLDDAFQGTLSTEGLEAVRAVYPDVYAHIQSKLADQINNAPNVPYNRKIQLSALLGQDMTGTLNPRLGIMAQTAYQSAGQPMPQQTAPMKPMKIGQGKALQGVAGREGAETQAWREAQRGARAGSGTR
jgi:hypothetical protein